MATTSNFGDRRSRVSFDRVALDDSPLGDRAYELSEGVEFVGEEVKSVTWIYDIANDRVIWTSPIEEFFGFEEGVLGFSVVPDDSVDQPVGSADQPGGLRASRGALRTSRGARRPWPPFSTLTSTLTLTPANARSRPPRSSRGTPTAPRPGRNCWRRSWPPSGRDRRRRTSISASRSSAPTGWSTAWWSGPLPCPPWWRPPSPRPTSPGPTTSAWSSTSPPSSVTSGSSASWSTATACSPRSPPMWSSCTRTGVTSTATGPWAG